MSDGYRLVDDADLATRNTFGIAARAPLLVEVDDAAALPRLFATGIVDAADPALLVLGGGSNLLFAADAPGPVLALTACNVETARGDDGIVIARASAGVPWHDFVMHTLSLGLCGLENLALIPGTVGAAPIQNIGAYGVEVRERVHAVEVFERATGRVQRLGPGECGFAYRDSAFKRDPARWIVTAVEFALSHNRAPALDYAGLRDELAAMDIAEPTAVQVAEAVIRIRRRKLPDPAVLGNAGSFFKNPIVPAARADALHAAHPALPVFRGEGDATRKLSAAWLIDACGWKGHRDGDAGVSAEHALVLVNHGHASGAQLLALARRIAASVQARFDIALEPEPRIVGAAW
ncbi:UDP-N-acetylmuramate dehydrogenase [Luteimonas mephitis]|uniref:UDP-N-acetylmuramate dehydrogenase n=1 Tax=Luteimonas mephitis TaxID=83615 RepID=UPI003A9204BB